MVKIIFYLQYERKFIMKFKKDILFCDYCAYWVHQYKEGAVRDVTLAKYNLVERELRARVPHMQLRDLDHFKYQKLILNFKNKLATGLQ